MSGAVWLRLAVPMLALLPSLGLAAAAPADINDIIEHLTRKPNAADLAGPTRGIKAIAPDANAARAPSIDLPIPFATGSATLEPSGSRIVAALGHALASAKLSGSRFKIEGHADTVGQADANLALSQRRAASVAALLSTRYGIAPSRLDAVGVGSASLVVQTSEQVYEPRNRVVRIINLGE